MQREDNNEFTLEKLRVSERLHEMELTLTKFVERFDGHVEADRLIAERLTKILEYHDRILLGNNGHDGVKIEVDRLNQKALLSSFVVGAVVIAVIGLVAKTVWAAMVGG